MLMCALLVHIAHEIAGAARIRHSLRPLISEGEEFSAARAQRVARSRTHILEHRHCEERSDAAIHSSFVRRDGLLRRFAPRNDVERALVRLSSPLPSTHSTQTAAAR